jgi:hypothetical protein
MVGILMTSPTVSAQTITALKQKIGVGDVSNTTFMRALNSLHFHRRVRFRKEGELLAGSRTYKVTLASS